MTNIASKPGIRRRLVNVEASANPAAPWDDRFAVLLGLACMAVWAGFALRQWWDFWPSDLSALYFAAYFFAEGSYAEVYASPQNFFGQDYPKSWTDLATRFGHPDKQVFPYIYPPLWAALFAPLAESTGPQAFFNAAYAWHIALMSLAPVLAYRIMRPTIGFDAFALISASLLATSVISTQALFQNQQQITVAVLVLFAFERVLSGHQVAGGALLGLAAAMKLSPIVLVVLFLLERQYRAATACFVVLSALGGLSVAVAGLDLHFVFVERLATVSQQLLIANLNLSLESVLFQLATFFDTGRLPSATGEMLALTPPDWLEPIKLGIFALGLLALLAMSHKVARGARLRNRFAMLSLWVTLCAPLSWTHHYLAVLFLVPGLIGRLSLARALVIVLGFAVWFSDANFYRIHQAQYALDWTVPISVALLSGLAVIFARMRSD